MVSMLSARSFIRNFSSSADRLPLSARYCATSHPTAPPPMTTTFLPGMTSRLRTCPESTTGIFPVLLIGSARGTAPAAITTSSKPPDLISSATAVWLSSTRIARFFSMAS